MQQPKCRYTRYGMAIVFLGVPLVRLEGTRLCNSPSADTQDMAKSYIQFVATYTDTSLLIKWSDARNCFFSYNYSLSHANNLMYLGL